MTNKILIYQEFSLYNFGLANSLQNIPDNEIYAIIDLSENVNKFFRKQNIVNYKKSWYLYENISQNFVKPDMEYLKNLENKYKLEIWKIAYNFL